MNRLAKLRARPEPPQLIFALDSFFARPNLRRAIAGGNAQVAADALKTAQPELMRGVSKGVVHKNTAARKISRLSSRVKALSAA